MHLKDHDYSYHMNTNKKCNIVVGPEIKLKLCIVLVMPETLPLSFPKLLLNPVNEIQKYIPNRLLAHTSDGMSM